MIINNLERAAAKAEVGPEGGDLPGEGVRGLAAKLRRKLHKTPPRWQASSTFVFLVADNMQSFFSKLVYLSLLSCPSKSGCRQPGCGLSLPTASPFQDAV